MQEGMPPAAGQEPPQGQGGGDVGQIIVETDKNLAMLAKALGASGQNPEAADALAQISEQFRALIDGLMGQAEGGQGAPPQKAPARGPAPAEAGGNPNARPMGAY